MEVQTMTANVMRPEVQGNTAQVSGSAGKEDCQFSEILNESHRQTGQDAGQAVLNTDAGTHTETAGKPAADCFTETDDSTMVPEELLWQMQVIFPWTAIKLQEQMSVDNQDVTAVSDCDSVKSDVAVQPPLLGDTAIPGMEVPKEGVPLQGAGVQPGDETVQLSQPSILPDRQGLEDADVKAVDMGEIPNKNGNVNAPGYEASDMTTSSGEKKTAEPAVNNPMTDNEKQNIPKASVDTQQPEPSQTKQPAVSQIQQPADGRAQQSSAIQQPAASKEQQAEPGKIQQWGDSQTQQSVSSQVKQPADNQVQQPAASEIQQSTDSQVQQSASSPMQQFGDDQSQQSSDSQTQQSTASHIQQLADGQVQKLYVPESPVAAGSSVQTAAKEDVMPAEYLQKLNDTIVKQMTSGRQEFEIQLMPKNLGTMMVKVVYEAGKAAISIVCNEQRAMQAMSEHARELGNMIENRLGTQTEIFIEQPAKDYLQQEQKHGDNREQQSRQRQEEQKEQQQFTDSADFLQQLRLGLT